MTSDLWEIVYISEARYGLDKDDIADILAVSQRDNAQEFITGMLLYSSGLFIQALEGKRDSVTALYGRIVDDRRHHDVDLLVDHAISHRSFDGWSMGFVETAPEDLSTARASLRPSAPSMPMRRLRSSGAVSTKPIDQPSKLRWEIA